MRKYQHRMPMSLRRNGTAREKGLYWFMRNMCHGVSFQFLRFGVPVNAPGAIGRQRRTHRLDRAKFFRIALTPTRFPKKVRRNRLSTSPNE